VYRAYRGREGRASEIASTVISKSRRLWNDICENGYSNDVNILVFGCYAQCFNHVIHLSFLLSKMSVSPYSTNKKRHTH